MARSLPEARLPNPELLTTELNFGVVLDQIRQEEIPERLLELARELQEQLRLEQQRRIPN